MIECNPGEIPESEMQSPRQEDEKPQNLDDETWDLLRGNLLFRDPSGRIPLDFYIRRNHLEEPENPEQPE